MMKINPESKPISEIFSIEGRTIYNIPIYQRNYSWHENNIEALYNDVINEDDGYYLGNLLVTSTDNPIEYNVVDGQQRLTTIALLFLAIYEALKDINNTDLDPTDLKSFFSLQTDIERKLITAYGSRLRLLESDQEIFESFLKVFKDQEKGKYGHRTFGKRYKFIQELISEKDDEGELVHDFKKLEYLYSKLNNVELLRITVNDLTDAYSVFTSLNAKGLPLTLIDLLKSYYLSEAVKEFSEKKALERWKDLIAMFMVNEEPNATAVTQFLQNNYDAFEGEGNTSITKKSSLRKYEQLFKVKGHYYMDVLIQNAELFSMMVPKLRTNTSLSYSKNLISTLDKLSKLDASAVFPLVLKLLKSYSESKVNEDNLIVILNYLINYYVRRNIVLKPKSSNIRAKAIQAVRVLNGTIDLNFNGINVVKENLNQISVSDEEFNTSLNGSIYDTSPQTVRFMLIEIERRYGKFFSKQISDTLDDVNQNGQYIWTLEHILPQSPNLTDDWKKMISPENVDYAEIVQKENMHKLGNLTLTGYNSELSNRDFVFKRDYGNGNGTSYLGLRTNLFINESIFNEASFEAKNTWTVEDINNRTALLAKLIVEEFSIE